MMVDLGCLRVEKGIGILVFDSHGREGERNHNEARARMSFQEKKKEAWDLIDLRPV